MRDGMKIDRRLVLLGVMIIVLSVTMATQYATTKISYRFSIVHPSNADIRFIGSDNSSGGKRVLRVNTNTSANQVMILELGNWTANSNKSYSAAFGIVNEEMFPVNITFINVTGSAGNQVYMDIWLHGNRTKEASTESAPARCKAVASGVSQQVSTACAWKLAAGDGIKSTMNGAALTTPWDGTSHIRFSTDNTTAAVNKTTDFVWVQITLTFSATAPTLAATTGQIWIHFKASTL